MNSNSRPQTKNCFHFLSLRVGFLRFLTCPSKALESSFNSEVNQLRLNMERKETHTRAPSEYEPSRTVISIVVVLLVIAIGAFAYYCYKFVERQTVMQQSAPAAPITTPEREASPSVVASGKRTPPTITMTPEPQEELPSEPISIPAPPATTQYRCDGRTRCSQMTSCDEAKFFLRNCPGTQMDGDSDGIPCEQQWCGH